MTASRGRGRPGLEASPCQPGRGWVRDHQETTALAGQRTRGSGMLHCSPVAEAMTSPTQAHALHQRVMQPPREEVPHVLTQPTGSFRHRSTQAQLLLGTGVLLHSASKSTLDDRYCNRDQLHRPRQRPTRAPLQRAACTSTRGPRGKPAACFGQPTTTPSI